MFSTGLDTPFSVTLFDNRFALSARRETVTLRQFGGRLTLPTKHSDKLDLPMWSPGIYGDTRSSKGSLRTLDNLQANTCLGADYDDEEPDWPDMATGALKAAGVAALLSPSPSWTAAAPRFRVIVPLCEQVGPDDYRRLMARLDIMLQGTLAPESYDPARAYFMGGLV